MTSTAVFLSAFVVAGLAASAPAKAATLAGPPPRSFEGEEHYVLPGSCTGVAGADFNGDGWNDVAVIELGDGSGAVSIWLNDATGRLMFHDRRTFPERITSVAAGDINGDGVADLAITLSTAPDQAGQVAVLPGLRNGEFGQPVSYLAGLQPSQVRIEDMNRDGTLDLVVVSNERVSTYLNRGDGILGPRLDSGTVWSAINTPRMLVIGDIDRDGRLDAVVSPHGSAGIGILRGRGDGTFWAPTQLGTTYPTWAPALADLDSDGLPDLVVVTDVIRVLWNEAGAFVDTRGDTISTWSSAVLSDDLDRDGRPDVAISTSYYGTHVDLLHGLGRRSLDRGLSLSLRSVYDAYDQASLVGTIDLDRDSLPDLLLARARAEGGAVIQSLGVVRHVSSRTFRAAMNYPLGGGSYELHRVHWGSDSVEVLQRTLEGAALLTIGSDGRPSQAASMAHLPPRSWSWSWSVVDIDGDGQEDLVRSASDSIEVLLKRRDRRLESTWLQAGANFLCSGDFNGDRLTDLVVGTTFVDSNDVIRQAVSLLLGRGSGLFAHPLATGIITGMVSSVRAAAADLNADGMVDLVISSRGPHTRGPNVLTTFLNNGAARLTEDSSISRSDGAIWPLELTFSDLDADGAPDLLLLEGGGGAYGNVTSFLNRGGRLVQGGTYSVHGENTPNLVVDDWNGDGFPDCAAASTRNGYDGHAIVLYGSGDGTFVEEQLVYAYGRTGWMITGDFNRDGRPDLLYTRSRYGDLSWRGIVEVFLNTTPPAATFIRALDVAIRIEPRRVTLGWSVSPDGCTAVVERRTGAGLWTGIGSPGVSSGAMLQWVDDSVIPGNQYGYRLRVSKGSEVLVTQERVVLVPGDVLAIQAISPNPSAGERFIRLSLPNFAPVRLEVFDVAGRRVFDDVLVFEQPGVNVARIAAGRSLEPGLYLIRATQDAAHAVARWTVLR